MPPAGASILLVPIMVELQALLYISTNYKLMLMGRTRHLAYPCAFRSAYFGSKCIT
nr:MAG TPA: hypothetical protein [Caudoviricetes sp.]